MPSSLDSSLQLDSIEDSIKAFSELASRLLRHLRELRGLGNGDTNGPRSTQRTENS